MARTLGSRGLKRAIWQLLCRILPDDGYLIRTLNELRYYRRRTVIHDLPPIFHYWSNRYLKPLFQEHGFDHPEDFFVQTCLAHCPNADRPVRIISLGSGNGDLELNLAQALHRSGLTEFRVECVDINGDTLERGMQAARDAGLDHHLIPIQADLNTWTPQGHCDIVLANQSLHHVVALEHLFDQVRGCIGDTGAFLVADTIGRNGHQRWPEALEILKGFWSALPESQRRNHIDDVLETAFVDQDCSIGGFEGIRAQDILPLLIDRFEFELFLPYACNVLVFVDRKYGPNFDPDNPADRDFVDRVHENDEAGLLAGQLKPTQMIAVLRGHSANTTLRHPALTPERCVRKPELTSA